MNVTVHLFGRAAEEAKQREVSLDVADGATMTAVADTLVKAYPALEWLPRASRPARNLEYVPWSEVAEPGDEISFIQPVSGGSETMVMAAVQDEPLELAPLVAFVERPEAGAVVTFSGNVRSHNRGRNVDHLVYDAYRPMAEKKLREIAEEAAARWDCRVAVVHRLGRLEIGEPSVLVAVSTAHRADGFDACRFVIDTLKQTVPIWKKEVWEDGEVWLEGEGESAVPSAGGEQSGW